MTSILTELKGLTSRYARTPVTTRDNNNDSHICIITAQNIREGIDVAPTIIWMMFKSELALLVSTKYRGMLTARATANARHVGRKRPKLQRMFHYS